MLFFLLGVLFGVILGGMLCVRYLRREIAADIGPRLKGVQLQLDNVETALNLAIATRYAELATRSSVDPPLRPVTRIGAESGAGEERYSGWR